MSINEIKILYLLNYVKAIENLHLLQKDTYQQLLIQKNLQVF